MTTSPDEEWRRVRDFPNYEVSNLGRVRRGMPGKRTRVGFVLKQRKSHKGYWHLCLWRDRLPYTARTNVLVCMAFHGPKPNPSYHAAHLDGDKDNNTAPNLAWVTAKENGAHKIKHGTSTVGERHWGHKLKASQVREIRERRKRLGEPPKVIAAIYGVEVTAINRLLRRATWKHI